MTHVATHGRFTTFARLREGHWRDAESLAVLSRRIAGAEAPVWPVLLGAGDAHVFVATECQLLVGAAVVWHHKGASTSRLSWIGVDPAARRRGVGSLLLESVMARASLGGAHDVTASVPEAAEGLGELLGARDFAAGKGGEWRLSLGG